MSAWPSNYTCDGQITIFDLMAKPSRPEFNPNNLVNVLSVFDGMACGMIAMIEAGLKVGRYAAYEIDKYAVKTSSFNFPNIEHGGDVFQADFKQYEGFDFLVGGSPCTYWSIAQTKNRETVASGMGWELFQQYVRALKEAKPKFFIYENNKSMSKDIRQSITETFGFEPICINSALVSAQNRQRLYWVGYRTTSGKYEKVDVKQPKDRGILLKDILETGGTWLDKSYTISQSYSHGSKTSEPPRKFGGKGQACDWNMAAEQIGTNVFALRDKGHAVISSAGRTTEREFFIKHQGNMVAEPICHNVKQTVIVRKYDCDIEKLKNLLRSKRKTSIDEISCKLRKPKTLVEHWFRNDSGFSVPDADSWFELKSLLEIETDEFDDYVTVFEEKENVFENADRCYDINGKYCTLTTQKTTNIIEPICVAQRGRYDANGNIEQHFEAGETKTNTLTTVAKDNMICEPICVNSKSGRGGVYYAENLVVKEATEKGQTEIVAGDCVDLSMPNSKTRRGRNMRYKSNCMQTSNGFYQYCGTINAPIYEVKDGYITVKDKQYPIKLVDGLYIIRKLTVKECMRLQTVPEWYQFPVSNSQAYKMLGNGWTIQVIAHLITSIINS